MMKKQGCSLRVMQQEVNLWQKAGNGFARDMAVILQTGEDARNAPSCQVHRIVL